MSDYLGHGQSNWFKTNNLLLLKQIARDYRLQVNEADGEVQLIAADDFGDIQTYKSDNWDPVPYEPLLGKEAAHSWADDSSELPYFIDVFSKLLAEGEILLWKHAGNDGTTINAYSWVIDANGLKKSLDLDDVLEDFTPAQRLKILEY